MTQSKNIRLTEDQVRDYRGRIPELMEALGFPRDAEMTLLELEAHNNYAPVVGPTEGPLVRITYTPAVEGSL